MSSLCDQLAGDLGSLFHCAATDRHVRIRTPFLYPDGDLIDLFWRPDGDGGRLTDYGETLRWLRMQSLSDRRTSKQSRLIDDVCLNHGVERYKGQLQVRVPPGDGPAEAVLRLAQAALAVSDLWMTFRTRTVTSVADEVATFLLEEGIDFDTNEKHVGRSGHAYSIDFHVRTPARSSLVNLLSTGSRSAAKQVRERVVATWYDLNHLVAGREPVRFVSLFDDTLDVWTDEDVRLLGELSEVALWSRPDKVSELLKAA